MNITQMHTAIDVGVNYLNSQHYRKLTPTIKDIVLNNSISEFALRVANDIGSTLLTYNTRDELKAIINNLRPLYTSIELAKLPDIDYTDINYSTFDIPVYNIGDVTSGVIYHNAKYYVVEVGTTNFTGIFSGILSIGETIVANINTINSELVDIDIDSGIHYKVLNRGTYDWGEVGYNVTDIRNGIVIKPSEAVTIPSGTNVILQPLQANPPDGWSGDTMLHIIDNYNILAHQTLTASVSTRHIAKGNISAGTYIITKYVEGDDLVSIGSSESPTVGEVFTCVKDIFVDFTNGSTIARLRYVQCMVVSNDVLDSLSIGGTFSSSTTPYATINNNVVKVYHNNAFTVHTLTLTYLRIPREVNVNYNISCDLAYTCHYSIVESAISKILLSVKSETYEAAKKEQSIDLKTHRI
jgi:hypothetical protein